MKHLVLLVASGCAVTTTTCPVGTKLTVTHGDQGRAEWCQASDQELTKLPSPNRTSESDLGLVQPPGLPGGVEGPFTAWYPTGVKEARGSYRNFGERSVPDGLWAFWYPSGALEVVGHYHRGEPVGCFASYDEHGVRHTGMVTGDLLTAQTCAPPSDAEVAALTGPEAAPRTPPMADVTLDVSGGPQRFGVANPEQAYADPGLTFAASVAPRLYLGRLRVGPTLGIRTSDASGYVAYDAGATVAWELPTLHPRLDAEVAVDVGGERMSVAGVRQVNGGLASADFVFWSPLAVARADLAIALTPQLSAVVGAGAYGWPGRTVETDGAYSGTTSFMTPVHETWQIGAIGFAASLGLRMLIR
jgi:hypothetical protein